MPAGRRPFTVRSIKTKNPPESGEFFEEGLLSSGPWRVVSDAATTRASGQTRATQQEEHEAGRQPHIGGGTQPVVAVDLAPVHRDVAAVN